MGAGQMKVGIVTWHRGNIGSSLQAYALSEILKNLGYEPEILNMIRFKAMPALRRMKNCAFRACFCRSGITRDNTNKFVKAHLKESSNLLYEEIREYSKDFGAVICGSDQIWSCVDEVNPFYFLQFADERKRISYAPSIGLNGIKKEFRADFAKYVSSIPYLSVRETKGAEIIRDLTGLVPEVVLDPTLLLRREDWEKLAQEASIERFGLQPGSYILCYFLGDQKRYEAYLDSITMMIGKKVVFVSTQKVNLGRNQVTCTVEEFLALIHGSYCVLTDSFHGTILSLNMEKKAAVFERFTADDPLNQNSRIYNILQRLGIENWLTSPQKSATAFIDRTDDWNAIRSVLCSERTKSLKYLERSLNCVIAESLS